jgi:hypothetical protein
MEGGGDHTKSSPHLDGSGQIDMAFQADRTDLTAREHTGIGGAVRLMATTAAFESYGGMFKGKRTTLVSVAFEATRFIGAEALRESGTTAPVGIVAIDATHGALRNAMMQRLLELRHHIDVAGRALFIDGNGLSRNQTGSTFGMNLVAGDAGHQVLHVATGDTRRVRGVAGVAGEAGLVG